VYGVWLTKGEAGEERTLRSSRAILLQQCGHYKWGGGGGGGTKRKFGCLKKGVKETKILKGQS